MTPSNKKSNLHKFNIIKALVVYANLTQCDFIAAWGERENLLRFKGKGFHHYAVTELVAAATAKGSTMGGIRDNRGLEFTLEKKAHVWEIRNVGDEKCFRQFVNNIDCRGINK